MDTCSLYFGKYLDRFLARWLCLVVLSLLVLLATLGQVGVVGQAAEKRRHHGAGVHLLLQRQRQAERCSQPHHYQSQVEQWTRWFPKLTGRSNYFWCSVIPPFANSKEHSTHTTKWFPFFLFNLGVPLRTLCKYICAELRQIAFLKFFPVAVWDLLALPWSSHMPFTQ